MHIRHLVISQKYPIAIGVVLVVGVAGYALYATFAQPKADTSNVPTLWAINEDPITPVEINEAKSTQATTGATKIEDCQNTGFAWSKMYTPKEQQRACALLTLAAATPVKISTGRVGDIPISMLQALAKGDFDAASDYRSPPLKSPLGECLSEANSNAAYTGCFLDVEESLQRTTRSLVVMQIVKEKEMSYIAHDTNPEGFSDDLKGYWQEWYARNTSGKGEKAIKCQIDATKAFGTSGWYDSMSECYVRYAAADVLWLLDQRESREKYFTDLRKQILP